MSDEYRNEILKNQLYKTTEKPKKKQWYELPKDVNALTSDEMLDIDAQKYGDWIKQSPDPKLEVAKINSAKILSQFTGNNFDYTYQNYDQISEQYYQKSNPISVGESLVNTVTNYSKLLEIAHKSYELSQGEYNPEKVKELLDLQKTIKPDEYVKDLPIPILKDILNLALPGIRGALQQGALYVDSIKNAFTRQAGKTAGAMTGLAVGASVAGAVAPPTLGVTIPLATLTMGTMLAFGTAVGTAESMKEVEAGMHYLELIESGVPHDIAKISCLIVGGVNSGMEMLQLGLPFGGVIKKAVGNAVVKSIASGTLKKIAVKTTTEIAKKTATGIAELGLDYVKEVLEEMAQETVSVIAKRIAIEQSNAQKNTKIPQASFDEDINRILDSGWQMAQTGIVLGLPRLAITLVSANKNAKQGEKTNRTPTITPQVQVEPAKQTPKINNLLYNQMGKSETVEIDGEVYTNGVVKFGHPESSELHSHIAYTLTNDKVRIDDLVIDKPLEAEEDVTQYKKDMIVTFVSRFPGLDVEWGSQADEDVILEDLQKENPRGQDKGLQWFEGQEDIDEVLELSKVKKQLKKEITIFKDNEIDAATFLIDSVTKGYNKNNKTKLKTSEFVQQVFGDKIVEIGELPQVEGKLRVGEARFFNKGTDTQISDPLNMVRSQEYLQNKIKGLIVLTKDSTFSEFTHEFFHVAERLILNKEQKSLFEKHVGKKWEDFQVADLENLANSYEVYLQTGKAPAEEMKSIFQMLSDLMTRFIQKVKLTTYKISPQLQQAFDSLVALPGSPLNESTKTQKTEDDFTAQMGGKKDTSDVVQGLQDKKLFSYIGIKANLEQQDKDNLSIAQQMETEGKDTETIRLATGWFKGKYDNKWRLENNDDIALRKPVKAGHYYFDDLILFPSLVKKYPEMKDVLVQIITDKGNRGGSFIPGSPGNSVFFGRAPEIKIEATTLPEVKSTLIHEIQHAIQQIEGFAKGGTPASASMALQDKLESLSDQIEYTEKNADKYGWETWTVVSGDTIESLNEMKKEQKRLFDSYMDDQLRRSGYTKISGEIEARDVAERLGYTDEQRRRTPPYSTENIAEEDAIRLYSTIDSPDFKRWFGDSKIVDENGEPLVVYHGTNKNFNIFRPFSHFGTKQSAIERLEYIGAENDGDIKSFYLKIENPLRVKDNGLNDQFLLIESIKATRAVELDVSDCIEAWVNGLSDEETKRVYEFAGFIEGNPNKTDIIENLFSLYRKGMYSTIADIAHGYKLDEQGTFIGNDEALNKVIIKSLVEAGYDGLVYTNEVEDIGNDTYIAFSPTQIKSVDNVGTWDGENPNTLYSTIDSPEFKRWFGDSKVVDEDGNPLVVYHGTDKAFDIFDINMIGKHATGHGYGFYFTTDKGIAAGYQNNDIPIVETYLSIKKPLSPKDKPFNINNLFKFINKMVDMESMDNNYKDTFISNYVNTYSMSKDKAIRETARIIYEGNDTAVDQISELANSSGSKELTLTALKLTLGYDGIYVKGFQDTGSDVWIAFSPTQIKSVDNVGTWDAENPNILYSTKEMEEELRPSTPPDINIIESDIDQNETENDTIEEGETNDRPIRIARIDTTREIVDKELGEELFRYDRKNIESIKRDEQAQTAILREHSDFSNRQTIVSIKDAQDWLESHGLPRIAEQGTGQLKKYIKQLRAMGDYRNLSIFDKLRIIAQLQRPIYKGDYLSKPAKTTKQNAKNKGELGGVLAKQNAKLDNSNIFSADTIVGCDQFCNSCFGVKGAFQSGNTHQHPIKRFLAGQIKTGQVLRLGEIGDPARDWGHTISEVKKIIEKSIANKQDVNYQNNVFAITKLQFTNGYNPEILPNLQVTLDPQYPDHMFRSMKNIIAIKSAYPNANITVRIRTTHTKNEMLERSQQIAIMFAREYSLPILETRMRYFSKEVLKEIEPIEEKYHPNQVLKNDKIANGAIQKTEKGIVEKQKGDYVCDEQGGSCPACLACVKTITTSKEFLQKQKEILQNKGIDVGNVPLPEDTFDPVGANSILSQKSDVMYGATKEYKENILYSTIDKQMEQDALQAKSWEDFRDMTEAFAIDDPIPEATTREERDTWYKNFYDNVHAKKPENPDQTKTIAEADKEFLDSMVFINEHGDVDYEGLENFLKLLKNATDWRGYGTQGLSTNMNWLRQDIYESAGQDEEFRAMYDNYTKLSKYVDPEIWNTVYAIGKKKNQKNKMTSSGYQKTDTDDYYQHLGETIQLDERKAKRLLGKLKKGTRDYRKIYADLTNNEQMKQQIEAEKKEIIESGGIDLDEPKYEGYSIEQKYKLAEKIKNEDLRKKFMSGKISLDMKEVREYVKELNQEIDEVKLKAQEQEQRLKEELKEEKSEYWKVRKYANDTYDTLQALQKEQSTAKKRYEKYKADVAESRKKQNEKAREQIKAEKDDNKRQKKITEVKEQYALERTQEKWKLLIETERQIKDRDERILALNEALKSSQAESVISARIKLDEYKKRIAEKQQAIRETRLIRQYKLNLAKRATANVPDNVDLKYRQQIEEIQKIIDPVFRKWITVKFGGRKQNIFDPVSQKWVTVKIGERKEKIDIAIAKKMAKEGYFEEGVQEWVKGVIGEKAYERLKKKDLNEWTIEELEEIVQKIEQMKSEGKAVLAQRQMAERNTQKELSKKAQYTLLYNNKKNVQQDYGVGTQEYKDAEKKGSWLRTFATAVIDPVNLALKLDGGVQGVFFDLLVNYPNDKIDETYRKMDERKEKVLKAMKDNKVSVDYADRDKEGISFLGKKETIVFEEKNERINADGEKVITNLGERKYTFTHSGAMYFYVGYGNERTREALLFGNAIPKEVIEGMIDKLNDNEKAVAKAIIDDFDGNYDRLAEALYLDINKQLGKEDHYVAMFRMQTTGQPLQEEMRDILLQKTPYASTIAKPNRGRTIDRIDISPEHQIPIEIGLLETWNKAVDMQENYIGGVKLQKRIMAVLASRYTGRDTRQLIAQKFGKEYVDWIDTFISNIANDSSYQKIDKVSKIVNTLVGNRAIAYLAYNVTSMAKQLVSTLPYLEYVGVGDLTKSAIELIGNPVDFLKTIDNKSIQFKSRKLDDTLEKIGLIDVEYHQDIINRVNRIGMFPLQLIDKVMVGIGWNAVYNKSIRDGKTEREAIRDADVATQSTQPSQFTAHKAQMYRDSTGVSKTITMFTQATNKLYNQMGRIPNAIKQKKVGALIGILTGLAMTGGWIGFMSRKPPDDEEEKQNPGETARYWLYNVFLSQPIESIPFLGSYISSWLKREPRMGSVLEYTSVTSVVNALNSIPKAMDEEKSVKVRQEAIRTGIENLVKAIGLIIGLPATAPVNIERAVWEKIKDGSNNDK